MKLALVTPVHTDSAIAHSSLEVARALANLGNEIQIISSEQFQPKPEEVLNFGQHVLHWRDENAISGLEKSHDFIFQVGDNFKFHSGVIHLLERIPGILILHDVYIENLLDSYIREQPVKAFLSMSRGNINVQTPPPTDIGNPKLNPSRAALLVLERASGVLVHSHWSLDRVRELSEVSVTQVPLIWSPIVEAPSRDLPTSGPIRLLSIGHVNPNKRVSEVIKAIGRSTAIDRIVYRVVGPISPGLKDSLELFAQSEGVSFRALGQVSELSLASEIRNADVVINLRLPVLEGASASLLQGLAASKPVFVTDSGHYGYIPDEAVYKIDPTNELDSLASSLNSLLTNPKKAQQVGREGRKYFDSTQNPERYAQELVRLIENCQGQEAVVRFRNRALAEQEIFMNTCLAASQDQKKVQVSLLQRSRKLIVNITWWALRSPSFTKLARKSFAIIPGLQFVARKIIKLSGV